MHFFSRRVRVIVNDDNVSVMYNRVRLPFEILKVRRSGCQCRADHGHGQRHRRERQQKLKKKSIS